MINARLKHIIKGYFQPSALVLMYHRIARPAHDVWDIAVAPDIFERQLQMLQEEWVVMPLSELLERAKKKSLKRNSVAITFDDGYQDNYLVAKPLLEKYGLPATFFISTGNTNTQHEFWWDELEELILGTQQLPDNFTMKVGSNPIEIQLGAEAVLDEALRQKLKHWKAFVQEPVTKRSKLFLRLWQTLRLLGQSVQQHHLQEIRAWAETSKKPREEYKSMSVAQLKILAQNQLFAIGGHTTSHPVLSSMAKEQQLQELGKNREALRQITGQSIETCSFPYGAYNATSIEVAQQVGFQSAFTTEEKPITRYSDPFQLGRIQVKNLQKEEFKQLLTSPR